VVTTLLVCGVALIASLTTSAASAAARPLQVFVSILPERYFVERIAGSRVDVSVMVGPGQSPATYEPRPRQIVALADSRIYFSIGAPFEDAWMGRIVAANPHMSIIDLSDGIGRRPLDTPSGPATGGAPDPHVWTSPRLMRRMAPRIRDALIRFDPAHRVEYERNCARLDSDLERLDMDVREQLSPVKHHDFLVFHPSWGYFADAYGLRQIPIETGGKEPGPRTLNRTIADARSLGIRTLFVQPQFSRRTAQFIAREIGAQLVVIDPLAEDYVANTRKVAAAIAAADKP
jgi:zinc transport system substrate-binding protein